MLKIVSGLVRKGCATVELEGNRDACTILFWATTENESRCISKANWPDDFIFDGEGCKGVYYIKNISEHLPFDRIVPQINGRNISLTDCWKLKDLYPRNPKVFEERFFRIKRRNPDVETLVFSLRQILKFYKGPASHISVSSVIFAYKAIDLCREDFMIEARDYILSQLHNINDLDHTNHPRTDRVHQKVSLMMSLWHLYLALGEWDSFCSTVEETCDFAITINKEKSGLAYNISKAFLMSAHYFAVMGDIEASVSRTMQGYEFFLADFIPRDDSTVLFKELGEAHKTVYLSMLIRDRLRSRKKLPSPDQVFDLGCRVRSGKGSNLMRQRHSSFLKRCRVQRRKEAGSKKK